MTQSGFGDVLRQLRTRQGMSLRELARRTHYDAGALSRVESGQRRPPDWAVVKMLDDELGADNALLKLLTDGHDQGATDHRAEVRSAADASLNFAQWAAADQVEQLSIDHLYYELTRVAADYVHAPVEPLFADLQVLRDQVWKLLESRPRPRQARELFFLGGVTMTLLAHASQNLGEPMAAMRQAMAGEKLAEQADHPGLRGWIAGTQALIAEWTGQPSRAVEYARRGSLYVPAGEGKVRLAALEARSAARSGDINTAREALGQARLASEEVGPPDEVVSFGGVLSFPATKALYYAGSTLTLIGDYQAAERDALDAIATYENGPLEQRSYGDEALARVDVAFARLGRDDLDGAKEALAPVLALPEEQRIRQIGDGLRRVRGPLTTSRYATEPIARSLSEEITAFRPAVSNGRALGS